MSKDTIIVYQFPQSTALVGVYSMTQMRLFIFLKFRLRCNATRCLFKILRTIPTHETIPYPFYDKEKKGKKHGTSTA